jgi:hypothetical protein
MKARRTCVALVLLIAGLAGPGWTAGVEDELRAAQAARIAATTRVDLQALGEILADELTYTHSSAKLETKAEFLEALRTGAYKYRSIAPRDVTARVYGEAAVLSGVAEVDVVSGGNPLLLKLRFTEVWVKKGGRWRLAAWQSTRMPAN